MSSEEKLLDVQEAEQIVRIAEVIQNAHSNVPEFKLAPCFQLEDVGTKQRIKHTPFATHSAFKATLSWKYWHHQFRQEGSEAMICEAARRIVNVICRLQGLGDVRYKESVCFWKDNREHLTPLTIVLHEIKEWACRELYSMDCNLESTVPRIIARIHYVRSLRSSRVWGKTVTITAGLTGRAVTMLMKCLVIVEDQLRNALNIARRRYKRRSARDKLFLLSNSLKDVMFSESVLLSSSFSFQKDLTTSKSHKFHPTSLFPQDLNALADLDLNNVGNICLFSFYRNELVRAIFMPVSNATAVKPATDLSAEKIAEFVDKGMSIELPSPQSSPGPSSTVTSIPSQPAPSPAVPVAPTNSVEDKSVKAKYFSNNTIKNILPCYGQGLNLIDQAVERMKVRVDGKQVSKRASTSNKKSGSTPTPKVETSVGTEIFVRANEIFTAMRKLVATIHWVDAMFNLAGVGGDVSIYHDLREVVLQAMDYCEECLNSLNSANAAFLKECARICREREQDQIREFQRKRKVPKVDIFLTNQRSVVASTVIKLNQALKRSLSIALDISRDAHSCQASHSTLNNQISLCRDLVGALFGNRQPKLAFPGESQGSENHPNGEFDDATEQESGIPSLLAAEIQISDLIEHSKKLKRDGMHPEALATLDEAQVMATEIDHWSYLAVVTFEKGENERSDKRPQSAMDHYCEAAFFRQKEAKWTQVGECLLEAARAGSMYRKDLEKELSNADAGADSKAKESLKLELQHVKEKITLFETVGKELLEDARKIKERQEAERQRLDKMISDLDDKDKRALKLQEEHARTNAAMDRQFRRRFLVLNITEPDLLSEFLEE